MPQRQSTESWSKKQITCSYRYLMRPQTSHGSLALVTSGTRQNYQSISLAPFMMVIICSPRNKLAEDKIHLNHLEISFHRTIRVSGSQKRSALPPSHVKFSLNQVENYTNTLPHTMATKGGLFLPIYHKCMATEKWSHC